MPFSAAEAAGGESEQATVVAATGHGESLTRAATRLSVAQIVAYSAGFITGPLLARALGATGRGHLAAIIVPITMLGWLAGLGLGSWVTVETSRERDLGAVLGTTGVLSIGLGFGAAIAAIPVAIALADGNRTVLIFMMVSIVLLPLSLFVQLLSSAAIGGSRWKMQARHRTVPAILTLVLTSGLFVADQLTLATAATVFLIGGLLSVVPLLPLVREARPLRFERPLAREALGFGSRAWASSLGALTNARLDQLLMIPLLPARQLGLYAVAVTYSTLPTVLSSALMTVIAPRVASGDDALVGRSLRVTVGLMLASGLCLSLLAPILLPLGFGGEFDAAVQMAWILVLAGVPLAATVVLTAAMTFMGRPGTPAFAQVMSGAVTVVGLLVLLPKMQAVGAALVSLIAYSISCVYMVVATARQLESGVAQLLRPRRTDMAWLGVMVRSARVRWLRRRPVER